MLTIKNISEMLQVSEETVRRWIRNKKLNATQEGKSYLVKEEDLGEFVEKMSKNSSTSIGKWVAITGTVASLGGAIAQNVPKDIVSKVFSKVNQTFSKSESTTEKPSVLDIEMYIQELRHRRKKRELEHQMELLEIDSEITKYEKMLEQLKRRCKYE